MPARTHLTFDEQLAAEAAFRGWPLESKWSAKAKAMYHGILARTQGRDIIEEAGGTRDEAGDYFVGPLRVMPAIDLMAKSDGDLSSRKRRKV
ncbi:MAG: hypothetical protein M3Z35_05405 [Nitrospirota bacterium]|nr:hypothetical protein [Nitrospirota bacterium]